jgi:hypothetical protein
MFSAVRVDRYSDFVRTTFGIDFFESVLHRSPKADRESLGSRKPPTYLEGSGFNRNNLSEPGEGGKPNSSICPHKRDLSYLHEDS